MNCPRGALGVVLAAKSVWKRKQNKQQKTDKNTQ